MKEKENIIEKIKVSLLSECENDHYKQLEKMVMDSFRIEDFTELDCASAIERPFTDNLKTRLKVTKRSTEYKNFLEECRREFIKTKLCDDTIKGAAEIKQKSIRMMAYKDKAGNKRWKDSNTKGSKSYGIKLRRRIMDASQTLMECGYEPLFITYTCDTKKYANSEFKAWNVWREKQLKKLKVMQKQTGAKCICVFEATLNQFPHIHIMAFFPRGYIKDYKKLPTNKKLVFGQVKKLAQKHTVDCIFDVRKPNGKAVNNYMAKYITKSNSHTLYKIKKSKGDLSKNDVKAVTSWLIPSMMGQRQVLIPRMPDIVKQKEKDLFGGKWTEEEAAEKTKKLFFTNLSAKKWEKICKEQSLSPRALDALSQERLLSATACRRYLIYLCTNWECHRKSDVRFLPANCFYDLYEKQKKENKGEKPNCYELIREHSVGDICTGCFWNDIIKIIKGNLDNALNVMYIDATKILTKGETDLYKCTKFYITKEDYTNDARFIAKLGVILNTYMICREAGCTSYRQFRDHYSVRQQWLNKAKYYVPDDKKIPAHWKLRPKEEIIDMIMASNETYCDINLDMEKHNLFDASYKQDDSERIGLNHQSLWQSRCIKMGTKGLGFELKREEIHGDS